MSNSCHVSYSHFRLSLPNEDFLVNAGDTLILSQDGSHLKRLAETHRSLQSHATFFVQEIPNPTQYGVIDIEQEYGQAYRVKLAVEKPERPPTNLAIIPVYIFDPAIFEALTQLKPGKDGEIQLTDAIQTLIDWGKKVYAVKLEPEEVRLDVGTPGTYREALELSFRNRVCS